MDASEPLVIRSYRTVFSFERRLYRVDPEALKIVREHLDRFWERSLSSFHLLVATDTTEKGSPDE